MICEACQGEGYVRGWDPENAGALVMFPCLECNGSGIASCCDAAGSRVLAANETPSRDPQAAKPLTDETQRPSFTCPRCGAVSYNPNDIRELYCGACHRWADRPVMEDGSRGYRDDTYPERPCDHCGKLYRGPAVYCSFECAVDDA